MFNFLICIWVWSGGARVETVWASRLIELRGTRGSTSRVCHVPVVMCPRSALQRLPWWTIETHYLGAQGPNMFINHKIGCWSYSSPFFWRAITLGVDWRGHQASSNVPWENGLQEDGLVLSVGIDWRGHQAWYKFPWFPRRVAGPSLHLRWIGSGLASKDVSRGSKEISSDLCAVSWGSD